MRASLKRRMMAYVIDILIVVLIATAVSFFLPTSKNQVIIEREMAKIGEDYLAHEISIKKYLYSYSTLSHTFDKENIVLFCIEALILFFYYQLIPYFCSGKTIGYKIMHIRIKDKKHAKVHFLTLLLRNLWMNGFGYFILFIAGLYLFTDKLYLFGITILAILQILVVIVSIFMIKYRRDRRSFADIVSYSDVVIES